MALSMIYIAAINSVFTPFLPNFSRQLGDYFKPMLDNELLGEIYKGNINALRKLFSLGYKLPLTPKPLIPKIDPESEVLKELRLK